MSYSAYCNKFRKSFNVALTGNDACKDNLFLSIAASEKKSENINQKNYKYRFCEFDIINLPSTDSIILNTGKNEYTKNYFCLNCPDTTVVAVNSLSSDNMRFITEFAENVKNTIVFVCSKNKFSKRSIKNISEAILVPIIVNDIKKLKKQILKSSKNPSEIKLSIDYDNKIKQSISSLENVLTNFPNKRLTALRLICGDKKLINSISYNIGFDILDNENLLRELARQWEKTEQLSIQKSILSTLKKLSENILKMCE